MMKTLKPVFVVLMALIFAISPVVMGANTAEAAKRHKHAIKKVKVKKTRYVNKKAMRHVNKKVVKKIYLSQRKVQMKAQIKTQEKKIAAKRSVIIPGDVRGPGFGRLFICSRTGKDVSIYIDEDEAGKNLVDINVQEGRHLIEAFSGNELIFRKYVTVNGARPMTVDISNNGDIAEEEPNFII